VKRFAAEFPSLTTDALLDWAEIQFPVLFAPAAQPTVFLEPYTYRYYPATQNFLGTAGDDIYVLGPFTGNLLTRVGSVADYQCRVLPQICAAPGSPTIQSIAAVGSSANINFSPPDFSGGTPILRYTATCTAGAENLEAIGSSSPISMPGMTIGTRYSCAVSASNSFGKSPPSVAVTVTPVAPPTSPPPKPRPPPGPPPAATRTLVTLTSDAGDWVGDGRNYSYTLANAVISLAPVSQSPGSFSVTVRGDEFWNARFKLGTGFDTLKPGTYFTTDGATSLFWTGEGRGCNAYIGSITIQAVTFIGPDLDSIALTFEQHCEGAAAALRGTIHWAATDKTLPPGPVNPPPSILWRPDAGAVPPSGNYVYLRSDPADFIGAGGTFTYTGANAGIFVVQSGPLIDVEVNGVQVWSGQFDAMYTLSAMQPGYYSGLQRYPVHNPAKGGLSWSGEHRGCNELTGWFAVDQISSVNGALSSLKLRFEQHCEGDSAALHGEIQWSAPP
jgi:hypothetical protein